MAIPNASREVVLIINECKMLRVSCNSTVEWHPYNDSTAILYIDGATIATGTTEDIKCCFESIVKVLTSYTDVIKLKTK